MDSLIQEECCGRGVIWYSRMGADGLDYELKKKMTK